MRRSGAIEHENPRAQPTRLQSIGAVLNFSRGAYLERTTIERLESRQNPHAGKRALRSAAFPGCGLAELSSSARGTRLRRTLVVLSRCARVAPNRSIRLSSNRNLWYQLLS